MSLSENIYRITFSSQEKYIISNTAENHNAVVSGKLRNSGTMPVIGDYVYAHQADTNDLSIIDEIVERKSTIHRKKPDSEHGIQIIAANVSHMLIVSAMDENFSLNRIERFLVLAKSAGADVVIALTKADLAKPSDRAHMQYETEERIKGAKVICTSVMTGEGISELKNTFPENSTVCLAGLSGAGKSSLINAITGFDVQKTKEVRNFDSKGRHTTTSRNMFFIGGFWIIDTPGIREVGLSVEKDIVKEVFEDIANAAKLCRFSDCTHTIEPDCEVRRLLMESLIDAEKLKNYQKLTKEAEKSPASSMEVIKERRTKEKNISKLVKSVKKVKKRF